MMKLVFNITIIIIIFTNHHHHQVCVLKFDHFENIHRLDPKLPSYEGAPNFRQVMIVLVVIICQFDCNVD